MSQEAADNTEWVLPFGHMVVSEAFNLEHSLSLTQNIEKLNALTDQLQNLRCILSDQNISEVQRINNALATIQEKALQQVVPLVEEKIKNMNRGMLECSNILMGEPTIKIDLAPQEDLQSSGEIEKTNTYQGQIQKQEGLNNAIVYQLKNLLRVREQQLQRLKKQKEECDVQNRKQISELTRKLQISQEKLSGCYCKIDEVKEISKMNKWLQTLNKMLKGAQKQAAMSKDELRRNEQVSARQLKEKDEIIQNLQAELRMHKSSPNLHMAL